MKSTFSKFSFFLGLFLITVSSCTKEAQTGKQEVADQVHPTGKPQPTVAYEQRAMKEKKLNQSRRKMLKSEEKVYAPAIEELAMDMEVEEETIVEALEIEIDEIASEGESFNTEEYDQIIENAFQTPSDNPLSTFSIDVDNASYTNTRRFIDNGQMPYKSAVRIEEFINYFDYDYPAPKGEHPFSVTTEMSQAPWNKKHKLVHIGLQGKDLDYENIAPSNLVFLIDVSGSMEDTNKLPLLRSSFKLLLEGLSDKDKVAIVVYAGAAGCVLPSTPATEKSTIMRALDNLQAGGSTAGGEGVKLAYKIAMENLIEDGNNRIILATDGDFNIGTSSTSELVKMIEEKRKSGIYLTICGFGMGNYKDGRMEQISNAGNGNYFYIDNIKEANKVFVKEMRATLFTIAKDVKIQVEFNPAEVQAYRLIGYENRMLKSEDFNDDTKDAGELGAGHTVTALYEIIPVGVESSFIKSVDELKYQKVEKTSSASKGEVLTVKLRYKKPDGEKSILLSQTLKNSKTALNKTSDNFRFSASVAAFGMLLRESEFKSDATYELAMQLAKGAKGDDNEGYRAEFISMVEMCKLMAKSKVEASME
ncbi:VWA domain-containing protein [Flammeovirgaceae bacterium SG7u.111]|nr:VWA domain-containing protein [Flammeovirgaceae bacterium SG7u.132]WPO37000.1 VWA domain-containing protein [Flammeovirgaceae bacterium SG7u.111]